MGSHTPFKLGDSVVLLNISMVVAMVVLLKVSMVVLPWLCSVLKVFMAYGCVAVLLTFNCTPVLLRYWIPHCIFGTDTNSCNGGGKGSQTTYYGHIGSLSGSRVISKFSVFWRTGWSTISCVKSNRKVSTAAN
jgi:hypothetical protein